MSRRTKKEFEIGDLVELVGTKPIELGIVVKVVLRTMPIKHTIYEIQWLNRNPPSKSSIQGIYLKKVDKNT
jgi:hypothetical protein